MFAGILGALVGWVPVIGPVVEWFGKYFNKKLDVDLEKFKTNANVDVEGIRAANDMVTQFKDDIHVRLMRDLAIFPVVVWSSIIGWDTIVAKRFPDLMFHIADYPENVRYIPYMVYVFLFGAVGLSVWKRK